MFPGYLLDAVKIDKVSDPTTAGTGDVTSSSVDMTEDGGYDGVVFMTSYGTAAAGNILKASQSADDSSWNELTSPVAPGASDEDQAIEVQRPVDRYVRAVAERGTSSTLGDIYALRYRSRTRPVTAPVAGTMAVSKSSSPAEV